MTTKIMTPTPELAEVLLTDALTPRKLLRSIPALAPPTSWALLHPLAYILPADRLFDGDGYRAYVIKRDKVFIQPIGEDFEINWFAFR